jgi:hypothetical protein
MCWGRYAENQEILTANDSLIKQQVHPQVATPSSYDLPCTHRSLTRFSLRGVACQSETILELERRLKMYEGEDGKGTATVKKARSFQYYPDDD